jgi:hypothetical protein
MIPKVVELLKSLIAEMRLLHHNSYCAVLLYCLFNNVENVMVRSFMYSTVTRFDANM